MKIKIVILLLIVSLSCFAKNMSFKMASTGTGYYPEYTSYEYDSPVTGIRLNAELYHLLKLAGIGGTYMFQLKSYDHRIDLARFYDVYVHNFSSFVEDDKYLLWGFYGGIRYTKLDYVHYKTKLDMSLNMNRPLLGFKFASETWGFDISWTQAENRKPILGYEIKFRSSTGVIFQIGRANRGPMNGAESDLHVYAGYEFFM
ncbi:MAG: hypothetical protein Q7J16_01430 [Candidatus Cloacimonadales bacterium]|nr:hypothetical protein [Candidatus Cloacimonadales bacterium]